MSVRLSSSPDAPVLLAFDTSGETVLVVLSRGRAMWTRRAPGGMASSHELLPAIDAVLTESATTLADLDAIAFCAGPGSFTGVRTGAAVAQGIALAHGLPVLPLNALELIADGAGSIAVVIDARMNEVYFAAYRAAEVSDEAGDVLIEIVAPTVGSAAQACAAFERGGCENVLLVGQPALLQASVSRFAGCEARTVDAARLAAGAGRAWRLQRGVAPESAQPLYVRDKVALTTAERDARKLAGGVI